jgi:branched-chain amino acid transport system permease protein
MALAVRAEAYLMADFLQQVVSGLASGGIYASLALALVLIYRATQVVNFAQGEMAMFTTFIAWSLMNHMPYWPAFVLTLAIAFAGGAALELALIRPVQNAPVLTVVIVTIGLLIGLNGLARRIWGSEPRRLESPFSTDPIRIGGVAFSIQDLGIIGVSLALVALLFLFFQYTKLGLALRAAALNPAASRLVGVRVSLMLALGWGLSAVLGAVAGMMAAPPLGSFDQNLMQPILLYAFAAAVLGGIDSPLGAVVGGLLLGVIVNLAGTYIDFVGADLRLPVALLIILAVLLLRPAGLFGREAVRRV